MIADPTGHIWYALDIFLSHRFGSSSFKVKAVGSSVALIHPDISAIELNKTFSFFLPSLDFFLLSLFFAFLYRKDIELLGKPTFDPCPGDP